MKKDKMVSSIMEFALEVDEKIILAKAIERYGDDPFKFGGQRDGFLEGYKAAFIEIKGVAPTKNKIEMDEHKLQDIWKKNLREFNDVMRLDSIIIIAMQEAIKEAQTEKLILSSVSICSLTDCNEEVSKNSNTLCIEHAYQRKMEGY